jgi:hypothetical protein
VPSIGLRLAAFLMAQGLGIGCLGLGTGVLEGAFAGLEHICARA